MVVNWNIGQNYQVNIISAIISNKNESSKGHNNIEHSVKSKIFEGHTSGLRSKW